MKRLPTRRDGHETRTRLLRVARETFEERGYHRTSVAEICRRASVANGTFYRYFNNKDEVFLLLAERLGHELEQALAGGLSRGHTIRDKIFRSQTIFYDYVRDNRALYQIFREAEFVRLDLPVQTYHRLARQLEQHLFPVDDSSIAVDDIARSAVPFAILGSAYMLATKYIIWDDRTVPADVVEAIADFIAFGLSPDDVDPPLDGQVLPGWTLDHLSPVDPTNNVNTDRLDNSILGPETDHSFDHDAGGLTEGERTRRRLLQAAQVSFGELGFFGTQIADITRWAGVAQGTFYVHFPGKVEILHELVRDISRRLRDALRAGLAQAKSSQTAARVSTGQSPGHRLDRRHVEIVGLATFLRWLDGRDGIYRIVREAEFVDESVAQWYYDRLVTGYVHALHAAMEAGEIRQLPTEPLAYCLLGIGHISGLRWVLWPKESGGGAPTNVSEVVRALSTFLLYGVAGVKAGAQVTF